MSLTCKTIRIGQGEGRILIVIQEVEAMSVVGAVLTIVQVGVFIHLMKETTSRKEMSLGMTIKSYSKGQVAHA